MKKQKFLDVNVINFVNINVIIIWIILDSKETTVFESIWKMLNHHAAHLSVCLCLHIETWCLNERLNEWIINKSFICLLILQKYIVWKLKIKIHDKLFYFLFQISTEILLKVIGKHFCIYLLIHCFQFLKLYTTQVDIACLLALHLRVFGFFWNVVINNWVH